MPYNVGVALRRFKSLIRWTAWRFSTRRLPLLSFEDIEAEGFVTLVQCCQSFPDGQTQFARYFKRAWYNRLKDLHRNSMRGKRRGKEVELDNALSVPKPHPESEFFERMKSRYEEISPLLSSDARRLISLLLEPSQELVEFAWRDFCRRNKLRSQGQPVSGDKSFRIRLRHIRGILKMSRQKVRNIVVEVRTASKHHLHGG